MRQHISKCSLLQLVTLHTSLVSVLLPLHPDDTVSDDRSVIYGPNSKGIQHRDHEWIRQLEWYDRKLAPDCKGSLLSL